MTTEEMERWNRFVQVICQKEEKDLSPIQKKAFLCFWYDAEMNSGGHCGYFDACPEAEPQELIDALTEIGGKEIADNFQKALEEGEEDDWTETDGAYYAFSPSLADCLQRYVADHEESIFQDGAD